ncbi:MAG TPA: hypothetical protein VGZ22_22295 [Isosphaeraceae bacterium]|jgi:hypothetical protein|nr:hypothetical protein [Isosphaeraceae bacterium]
MSGKRLARAGVIAGVAILFGSAWWTLRAQDDRGTPKEHSPSRRGISAAPGPAPVASSKIRERNASLSVQDALVRPCDLPFGRETTLAEFALQLGRMLDAPVVLDQGALARQHLTEDDTVQLELNGVRLKTGLKLLLGQVGLTYQVVPEDNLLVITDPQEADERYGQILDELKSLHRDVHMLQDLIEELLDDEFPEETDGGRALQIAKRAS